jgi:hypothetical protein
VADALCECGHDHNALKPCPGVWCGCEGFVAEEADRG